MLVKLVVVVVDSVVVVFDVVVCVVVDVRLAVVDVTVVVVPVVEVVLAVVVDAGVQPESFDGNAGITNKSTEDDCSVAVILKTHANASGVPSEMVKALFSAAFTEPTVPTIGTANEVVIPAGIEVKSNVTVADVSPSGSIT